MHYCRIPAGYLRKNFGFESLPDFDKKIWQKVKRTTDKQIRDLPEGLIRGNDISGEAVKAAKTNASCFAQAKNIRFSISAYQKIKSIQNSVIITNPPYGLRLGAEGNMDKFVKELGDFLKKQCTGSTAYLYFGNRELIKKVGLKPSWKKPLISGGLDGRLVKYSLS